jgi:hypothetical protein
MTDINLKEMMFAKRMKAIEDDVPPVGYIDDGLDDTPQGQQHDPQWHSRTTWEPVEEW